MEKQKDYELEDEVYLVGATSGRFTELLSQGMSANERTDTGRPVFHLVCEHQPYKLVRRFLQEGANPNTFNAVEHRHGFIASTETPLNLVIERDDEDSVEMIKLLVAFGANPNLKSDAGLPILNAVSNEFYGFEIVEALVECGADINISEEDGRQAIHYARDVRMLELLLRHGADFNAVDVDGKTPLHFFDNEDCEDEIKEAIEFLVSNGADIYAVDNDGRMPSHPFIEKMRLLASVDKDGSACQTTDKKKAQRF